MAAISPTIVIMMLLSAATQIFALSMLPLTRGFTQPLPTAIVCIGFLLGLGILSRVAHAGVNLGVLIPILAAVVPLGTILVGVFAYGEVASLAKISALIGACILIGVANML